MLGRSGIPIGQYRGRYRGRLRLLEHIRSCIRNRSRGCRTVEWLGEISGRERAAAERDTIPSIGGMRSRSELVT